MSEMVERGTEFGFVTGNQLGRLLRYRSIFHVPDNFTYDVPAESPGVVQTFSMVEDKYIGLALAVSSSLAIGTSFIITKKVSLAN
jgi:hypothetical protein